MIDDDKTYTDYFVNEIYPLLPEIRAYIETLSKDPYLADDVTEDVMLMVWDNIVDIYDKRNIKPYLFKCAKNRMFYYYKKNSRIIYVADPADFMSAPAQDVIDTLIELIKKENLHDAAMAMRKLTPLERRILLMYYFYDHSLKDISKATRVNYNTVSTLKRRALNKLASDLDVANTTMSGMKK